MNIIDIVQILSGVISLVAYGIYIYSIWFGETRPSKSSWWILAVVWMVVLFSSIALAPGESFWERFNANAGSLISIAYIIGSFIIAISTIWRGSREPWNFFDWTCVVFAMISVLFFLSSQNLLISLIAAIVADIAGVLPTIKNAWKHPKQEHFTAWFLESVASLFAVITVTRWTLDVSGFSDWSGPLYLFIANTLITIVIIFRKNK